MQALQMTRWQHDAELRAVAEPEPGPGQVLVRIGGAGACHSDLHLMHDFESMPFDLPFTLGHENAGWVEALGAGVTGVEVGEPVAVYGAWGCGRCRRCLSGMENYCERQAELGDMGCGLGRDGGMADLLVVPHARYLVPLGDLDPVEAAPLTDAGLTPYHAVKRSLSVLVPGSRAVVIGVGGLGHMAVQVLRALSPATVVAVDASTEALALAAELGAEHTVEAGPLAALAVRERCGGVGADLVLDFVGSDDTLALASAAVRPLGHVTIVGIAGGTLPMSFFTVPYEASVASTYWGSLPELTEVLALASAGHLRARVERFPLERATEAYAAMRAGTLRGRAVIVP